MNGTDLQGRKYLTFAEAKAGRSVILDGDFTCAKRGARKILRKSHRGLWFRCDCGKHYIEGQEDFDGGEFYVGLYRARTFNIRQVTGMFVLSNSAFHPFIAGYDVSVVNV
jgi:hypothetical protein